MRSSLAVAAALAVVLATFAPALPGGYVYDDLRLIAGRPPPHGIGEWLAVVAEPLWGPAFPHWRPLTQLLLAAGNAAGGAIAIHALALAVHLAAVVAAFALARALGAGRTAAAIAGVLFAVHPAQAESVGWCSALNDVLWGACGLGALVALAAARRAGRGGMPWPVVAWFAAALLAKETALVLPVLFVLLDRALARPDAPGRTWFAGTGRIAAVVAVWLLLRIAVFGDWRAGFDRGPTADAGSLRLVLLPLEVLGRLSAVLVWPFTPSALRPLPRDLDSTAVAFACGGLLVAGAAGVALVRGPRWLGFAAGVVVAVLALHAVRPITIGEFPIADRYLHLPAFGLALVVIRVVARWRGGWIAAAALAAVYAGGTRAALPMWRGQAAFVAHHLERHDHARVHYLAGQGALLAAPPDFAAARAAFGLAKERARQRHLSGAEEWQRLLADIDVGLAWCDVGSPQPNWRRVAAAFQRVLSAHESHAEAHVGLAVCLAELGDFAGAEHHLHRALALVPGMPAARVNLARLQQRRRQ